MYSARSTALCYHPGWQLMRAGYHTVGYHLPFQHNELFHLPYMAVAEINLRVRPEEPFLLLKYIITLSLILCSYYLQSPFCKYSFL